MGPLLPVQASAHAASLDTVTLLVHALMAAMLIGWGSFFVYVLVRFRSSRQPEPLASPPRGRLATWSEIAVVGAEVVLLAAFSIPAWASLTRDRPVDAMVVRVVAEQFAWNVHYPGADGRFGRTDAALIAADNPLGLDRRAPGAADDVVTANLLALPVGRPVIVQLSARDVIHSFGVAAMRVKHDAIPGMTVPVWFTPTTAGEFEVACSQLCGIGHYRMRAIVRVLSAEDFAAWLLKR